MSLQPRPFPQVPEQTARVARAAFRKGHLCLRIRDELGPVFTDEQFADLYGRRGKPGISPARLAWVVVLQFLEGLTDRQAADAVRSRIEWKYLLGLELDDPGFDHSVLSEFRDRLADSGGHRLLLDTLLDRLRDKGLLKPGGKARTDSTHLLAAVRVLNRLENIHATLCAALEAVAGAAPRWLAGWLPADWVDRYAGALKTPKTENKRRELAEQVGADGRELFTRVTAADAPAGLARLDAVEVLRRVWAQQFVLDDRSRLCLRDKDKHGQPPAGLRIDSPFDAQARHGVKRGMDWTGYKAHLTETCDPGTLHVITRAEAAPATDHDGGATTRIQDDLGSRDLLPAEHLLDNGYLDTRVVVATRERHGTELVGPLRTDVSWQARAGQGFALAAFHIDFDQRHAICPQGMTSSSWREAPTKAGPRVQVEFSRTHCRPCPSRALCISPNSMRRNLTLHTRAEHQTLTANRTAQTTQEWKTRYRLRAGVEGTISQATGRFGLRWARYIGLAKTQLQTTATAAAINIARLDAWLTGTPHATTRMPRIAKLGPAIAA
jgi:transposase